MKSHLRVSVGLPVYNGGRFLKEALDSILAQTFADFELILSDNASTDNTEEICRVYAERDERIRYSRNKTNLGAAKNFNRTFELSSGQYFKWAAHDDICAPDFLLRCAEALDRDPTVILCYPRQLDIDEHGRILGKNPYELNTNLVKPHERFREVLRFWRGAPAIWGVMRRSILKKTPLIGDYYASDLVLLAELALYGRFHEVREDLLLHREHPTRSVYAPTRQAMTAWLNPLQAGRHTLSTWRWFVGYLSAVGRSPLSWQERLQCWIQVARWLRWRWGDAVSDLSSIVRFRRAL